MGDAISDYFDISTVFDYRLVVYWDMLGSQVFDVFREESKIILGALDFLVGTERWK